MAEYIERKAAIDFVKKYTPHIEGETTLQCVVDAMKKIPTADVVEVKRGHWERGWDNGDIYAYCTACKRRMNYHCYGYAHCALCGARMDGRSETNAE